jgi:D-alanyl-D-alanine carboxypeptidase/D-alanyl-D-alanine-endopeptidase (penicillin-binding protein 4)
MAKSLRKRINSSVLFIAFAALFSMTACSIQKAQRTLLTSASLKGAHVGIAVFNETTNEWIDRHQSDHYYIPASTQKLQTCYLGMKYLKDSIPGWKFAETKDSIFLMPLGDPSFMHPDFAYQPIVDLIKSTKKQIVFCLPTNDHFSSYGMGWSWEDYAADYQPERSRLNIYGNVVTVSKKTGGIQVSPSYFTKQQALPIAYSAWSRDQLSNQFFAKPDSVKKSAQQIPFITNEKDALAISLIEDSLHPVYPIAVQKQWNQKNAAIIKTAPTDSLLKIMMSRSDNLFAEQVLLMTSQQVLGRMDDAAIIDTLLKTDFASFPQKPVWVDGSGLSRYNLNTPENFIALLQQMEREFSMERIKSVFTHGGQGTLTGYYKNVPGVVYAKTGTLGNQIALSGYMITNKGNRLLFSVLVSNHVSPTTSPIRHAVEKYLTSIMNQN